MQYDLYEYKDAETGVNLSFKFDKDMVEVQKAAFIKLLEQALKELTK